MKKLLLQSLRLLLVSFTLLSSSLTGQTVVWEDQFEATSGFGEIPAGYGGGMRVYATHGISNSKAICIQYSQFKQKDSTITTATSVVPPAATLTFDYRFVYYSGGFPTGGFDLTGDTYKVYITEASSSDFGSPVLTIDSSTHSTMLAFTAASIDLSAFSGQSVKIKFVGKSGAPSDDYWLDMDNLKIVTGTSTSVNPAKTRNDFSLFPNPASDLAVIQFNEPLVNARVELVNMLGASVFKKQVSGNKINLELEQLPRGVYYVKIQENSNKELIKKLILR